MKNKVIPLIVSLLLALGVSYTFKSTLLNTSSTEQEQDFSHLGSNFTLSGDKGPVSLSSFKDKIVVLYFGFTTCPDVCPMALTKLRSQLKKLPYETKNLIQPIFISVDWKRDTPKSTQEYASFFGKNIVGLTGTVDEINKVTREFSVYYNFVDLEDSEVGYTVDHTSRYFVIDGNGTVRGAYSDIVNDKKFIKQLKKLTKEI